MPADQDGRLEMVGRYEQCRQLVMGERRCFEGQIWYFHRDQSGRLGVMAAK